MLATQPPSLGIDENRIDDLAQNVAGAQQIDRASLPMSLAGATSFARTSRELRSG